MFMGKIKIRKRDIHCLQKKRYKKTYN